ncbi:MAG: rhamnulokinase [Clostridia bacterium]|nr:rhamnulokinase [Clostridia bacterium]MBR5771629.1 rhamnulokinase [Clostridia bacterium]
MSKRILAIDFGASSGRAIVGTFDGEKIKMEEVHRFSNDPVQIGGTVYWDVLRLFYEIKQGIMKAAEGGRIDSVGIDTWGVDFGLIDKNGDLLENPVHYRDARTAGLVKECGSIIPNEEFYGRTGIQFLDLNTVYQLYSLKKERPYILERTDKLLFMPDLFGYFLTGKMTTEYSIATTSQMVDIKTKTWANDLLEKLGIPSSIMCDIRPSGSVLGKIRKEICEECGIEPVDVISVCGHDTQSAITAVPSSEKDFAFLSSGTWSLFGTELDTPVVTDESRALNITNEGGYGSKVGFLKNITGLWLIQESRRHWNRHGNNYSYADLEALARKAEPFKCFINPDAPEFLPHGNIPGRIREFCQRTGQPVPENPGEVMRCIYESLAFKYRQTLESIEKCTGKTYPVIHIIGGGTKDTFLSGLTACSTGRKVISGPVEATVFGNLAVQLLSCGDIKSIEEARQVIARSEGVKQFMPENTDEWNKNYDKFLKIM